MFCATAYAAEDGCSRWSQNSHVIHLTKPREGKNSRKKTGDHQHTRASHAVVPTDSKKSNREHTRVSHARCKIPRRYASSRNRKGSDGNGVVNSSTLMLRKEKTVPFTSQCFHDMAQLERAKNKESAMAQSNASGQRDTHTERQEDRETERARERERDKQNAQTLRHTSSKPEHKVQMPGTSMDATSGTSTQHVFVECSRQSTQLSTAVHTCLHSSPSMPWHRMFPLSPKWGKNQRKTSIVKNVNNVEHHEPQNLAGREANVEYDRRLQ